MAGLLPCPVLLGVLLTVLLTAGCTGAPHPLDPPTTSVARLPTRAERAGLAQQALDRMEAQISARRDSGPGAAAPSSWVPANAARLPLDDVELDHVAEDAGAFAAGSDSWTAGVRASWRFAGYDATVAHAEIAVTFRVTTAAPGVEIAAIGGHGRRTPLWLAGPVTVARSRQALVLAAPGQDAADYLDRADRAVRAVRQVVPGWPQRGSGLVVEVPGSAAEVTTVLAARPGEYDEIAAVTTTADGRVSRGAPERIVVNPDVFDGLRPTGAQVVMTHEATHVALRAANAEVPLWLLEGYADHVALRSVGLPVEITAARILAAVRAGRMPEALPEDAAFATGAADLDATYEAAWLACDLLARLGGEAALLRFYRGVDAGAEVDAALRRVYGLSERTFTHRWRDRLRDLAE